MLLNSLTNLPVPVDPGKKYTFSNLLGAGQALLLASLALQSPGLLLVITPDSETAAKLERELKFFLRTHTQEVPVFVFPDRETLPFDSFSPHQDIISERLSCLYHLRDLKKGILLTSVVTLMHRVSPKGYIDQNTLCLKNGQQFSLEDARKRFTEAGYRFVPQVMEHGEFAIRGSILDLFPMGSDTPFRIDMLGDEIESIRTFEVETQRSLEKKEDIQLLPAREFPLTPEAISTFRTRFRDQFEGDPTQSSVYLDVSDGHASPGLEYYLPLFFEKTSHLFEYCPKNSIVVQLDEVESAAGNFWSQVKERHDLYGHDRARPILSPKDLFLQPTEIFSEMNRFPRIQLSQKSHDKAGIQNLPMEAFPDVLIESRSEKPLAKLADFLKTFKGRLLFLVESAGRREILKELLLSIQCRPKEMEDWDSFLKSSENLAILISPLEEGAILEGDLALMTEAELLGQRVMQRRLRKARKFNIDIEVQSLAELTLGSPVVHVDYGIGRYCGLTRLVLSDTEGEFLTLEYAGGDKLYVPVGSLNLISRYSGVDLEHAPLHRLGSEQWRRAKRKALEEVNDVAAELLEIYAIREAKKGHAFPKPDEHYEAFSAEFPFEETPDQKRAIEEVIQDLIKDKPMDRVVCGDVGFGKTEVALRASFLAVQGGKQVAVLVPTTLLAEQHFQTFSDRFSGFPIRVEVISRFRSQKEQEKIIQNVVDGKVDILIGTHKILQGSIHFKFLGLLIIDEEHRFGVKQKEAFKALRAEVDILTLTATPIPRTLNMAMSGLRDLSIIATPPARRLSVKTFVYEKQSLLISEAIMRELHRGGQVYYLHNTVESIEREANFIQSLVPTARVVVAHGQMHERDLEQVMSDFYHRRYNVLICTTIIETGIDIPTANTIIIDRADKFGLADLHQLRGRVGRSHHQAYAFCLIPPKVKITADAEKRLKALAAMEDLGGGFTLATHDLEIRGAGELLGESQSGNIQSVGFSLYRELLEEAIKTLKKGETLDLDFSFKKGVEVELHIPALLPEAMIPDVHTRLVLYKRIANCKDKDALQELSVELIDRFGKLPDQVHNLFKMSELKLQAARLGIAKIEAGPKGGRFEFIAKPSVDPSKIIRLIQEKPALYRLEGPQKLQFKLDLVNVKTRIEVVQNLITSLS